MRSTILLTASLVLLSTSATARWIKTEETSHKADKATEILRLLRAPHAQEHLTWLTNDEVERRLAGFTARHIAEIHLTVGTYRWAGDKSSCPAGDRRQFRVFSSGRAKFSDGAAVRWKTTTNETSHWDPCGWDAASVKLFRNIEDFTW